MLTTHMDIIYHMQLPCFFPEQICETKQPISDSRMLGRGGISAWVSVAYWVILIREYTALCLLLIFPMSINGMIMLSDGRGEQIPYNLY